MNILLKKENEMNEHSADATAYVLIFLLIILFTGEPDILDGIIMQMNTCK